MILIIAGPTGSGKSTLSVALAKMLDGEVVNIDSVQLYSGCVIGAATITAEEQQGVPHHLFGIVKPDEVFDVAKYIVKAQEAIEDINSRGKVPIFTGGTALYITALLYGLADLPPGDEEVRIELEKRSDSELFEYLSSLDPESAKSLHLHDRHRVIRAIESTLASGTPMSSLRTHHGNKVALRDAYIIAPIWDRGKLYDRIEERTKKMIAAGLIDEVSDLVKKYGTEAAALRSIGYAETVSHLMGRLSAADLEQMISQNTRRFAKRQMTWLRNQPVKQGWHVRPNEGDSSFAIEGDMARFAKPGKVKQFTVWDIDQRQLIEVLQKALKEQEKGIDMLFVPGAKVV